MSYVFRYCGKNFINGLQGLTNRKNLFSVTGKMFLTKVFGFNVMYKSVKFKPEIS